MALNPSCNGVQDNPFPVLGDPPFNLEAAKTATAELMAVMPFAKFEIKEQSLDVFKKGTQGDRMGRMGIHAPYEGMEKDIETITVRPVEAAALGWRFRRAWYYWVCRTDDRPIPEAEARRLNDVCGGHVRVDGFAGGKGVTGAVDCYHVDTPEGLAALVAVIQGLT